MDLKIKGKTAIVTGAGNGLGRAIALGLATEGAKVTVADLKKEDAEKVTGEIKAAGNDSLAVSCDATNPDDVDQMVKKTLEAYGDIDILVNNVGGGFDTGFVVKTSTDLWDQTMELNLKSAFLCCRAVAHVMMKNKKGRIINISSVSGRQGEPLLGPYCAAKFGVTGLTQVLAKELSRFDITVNAVCPGYVYTPGWEKLARLLKDAYPSHAAKSMEEIFAERVKSVTPLGRPQTAEEIASLVAYLASEEARSVTGQSISIDGGIFMN